MEQMLTASPCQSRDSGARACGIWTGRAEQRHAIKRRRVPLGDTATEVHRHAVKCQQLSSPLANTVANCTPGSHPVVMHPMKTTAGLALVTRWCDL